MYRIAFDPAGDGVLRLTLSGFWDADELARFSAEFATAAQQAANTHPRVSILSDAREFAVQSAEISAGFAGIMATMSATKRGGRTAIIVATALNRMQAGRVFTNPAVGVFMDADEGLAWLRQGDG